MKLCNLCGAELVEDACPNEHGFKKMCVNCQFSTYNEEEGEYICNNEENAKSALDKIRKAAQEAAGAYEIGEIQLKPLVLKKPTAKCGKWILSEETIEELKALFA